MTSGDTQDRDGGCWLLDSVRGRLPRMREVLVDSAFSRRFRDWVRRWCGWPVTTSMKGTGWFMVQARRWVVERTFAWLVRYRRLVIDYEYLPETTENLIYAAMIHRMLRTMHPTRQ